MASMNYKGQAGSGVGGKMKDAGAVKASIRHDDKEERIKVEHHKNEHIDKTLTPDNVDFMGLSYREKCERFDARIKELDDTTNKNIRKDRVLAFGLHATIPDTLPIEQQIEFARDIVDLYADKYGHENIIAADFHQDEGHYYIDSRTHNLTHSLNGLHITIVPEIDGQLNARAFSSRGSMKIMNREIDKIAREKYGIEYIKHEEHERGEYKSVEEMQQMSDEFYAERKQELDNVKQDIERTTQELNDIKQELKQTQDALRDVRDVEQFASGVEDGQIGKNIPLNGGVIISKEDVPALQKMAGIAAKLEDTLSDIRTQTDALDARQNDMDEREQEFEHYRQKTEQGYNRYDTYLDNREAELNKREDSIGAEVEKRTAQSTMMMDFFIDDVMRIMRGENLRDNEGHLLVTDDDFRTYLTDEYGDLDDDMPHRIDGIIKTRQKVSEGLQASEYADIGYRLCKLPKKELEAISGVLGQDNKELRQDIIDKHSELNRGHHRDRGI